MAYTAKSYDNLKGGALKGLSDAQLDQHFTLYKGYIAKLNEIETKLATHLVTAYADFANLAGNPDKIQTLLNTWADETNTILKANNHYGN